MCEFDWLYSSFQKSISLAGVSTGVSKFLTNATDGEIVAASNPVHRHPSSANVQGAHLLTWINFNSSMDKSSYLL